MKTYIGLAILAFCVFFAGYFSSHNVPLGSSAGTEHYNIDNFYSGLTLGTSNGNRPVTKFVGTSTDQWNHAAGTAGLLAAGSATSTEIAVSSTVTGFATNSPCYISSFTNLPQATSTNAIFTATCYYQTSTAILSVSVPASSSVSVQIPTGTIRFYQFQF